jgi:hypothetical protein
MRWRKARRPRPVTTLGTTARAVAVRETPNIGDSSPKWMPGPARSTTRSPPSTLRTSSTRPDSTT